MKNIEVDDLVDFGDLGDLLKSAGIIISQTGDEKNETNPFSLTDPIIPEIKSEKDLDNCIICCNPLYMKVTLPCNHDFCYNCIKGIIVRLSHHQPALCPLCQAPLPQQLRYDIKKKPHVLDIVEVKGQYLDNLDVCWFYAARQRGYWAFDIASNSEIEALYQKYLINKDVSHQRVSICGMTRIFDFDQMLQINEYNDNTRRIKRVEKKDMEQFNSTGLVRGLAGYTLK